MSRPLRRALGWIVDHTLAWNLGGLVAVAIYGRRAFESGAKLAPGALTVSLFVVASYYLVCESVYQRTLGKALTGTRVVAFNGAVPSPGAVALRTISRIVPLGWIGGFVGWTLHDVLSKTEVIVDPPQSDA